MKYIDTHAHLNLSAFAPDVEAVIEKCNQDGVGVINIGTKESTSARAVELALTNPHLYAIVGLHPIQTVPQSHDEDELGEGGMPFVSKGETFNTDFYRNLIATSNGKVVGIGECGFDYYHTDPSTYITQEVVFIEQIKLANELQLPLMIHTRGPKPGESSPTGRSVYADVHAVLKQYAKVPFNVHFYAGTLDEAKAFFDIGGTISFTGVITFAKVYEDIVRAVPLDRIHAETDCPYVAPIPYRGARCEPWMVQEVYKKIAQIRDEDTDVVREQLLENAHRLYTVKK
ncbi:TatD family hydrolase [Patescibacteria group bacterium]|nr:TatD family hydrolase [Patescibacteria group bacterium]